MKLSILIPSYNRRKSLQSAVDSVLLQNHFVREGWVINHDYEIIVIDDGSSDGTFEHIGAVYPALVLLQQANKGVSAARNAGLQAAKGEWIALLDSDDIWLPDKLSLQFGALNDTNTQVCHTEEIWIRNGVRVNQHNKHQKHGGLIYSYCLPLCAMSPSSIMLHRNVFERVGQFDENLPACEDYDLWLRVCAFYKVAFVSSPQIHKTGGHADQLSRQHWGMDRFRVIALEKIMCMSESEPTPDWLLSEQQLVQTRNTLLEKVDILRIGAKKHANRNLEQDMNRKIERWCR
jgi:glycosyltransferase involved in cell wall biosynthesis